MKYFLDCWQSELTALRLTADDSKIARNRRAQNDVITVPARAALRTSAPLAAFRVAAGQAGHATVHHDDGGRIALRAQLGALGILGFGKSILLLH